MAVLDEQIVVTQAMQSGLPAWWFCHVVGQDSPWGLVGSAKTWSIEAWKHDFDRWWRWFPSGMSLVILVEDAKFWLLRLSAWLGVSTETATSLGSLPSTSPSKRRSMSGMTSSCTSQNVREPGAILVKPRRGWIFWTPIDKMSSPEYPRG